jgi:hypothetical protein
MVKYALKFAMCSVAALAATLSQAATPATKPAVMVLSMSEPKLRPAAMSAAQIVERNAAARGGLETWRKITSLSMSGKMDAGRAKVVHPEDYVAGHKRPLNVPGSEADRGALVQVPFTMEFQRPRKSRVEIDFHGQRAVQIYDGTKGFKLRPYLNRNDWQPFSADETREAARQQELDGALMDYSAKGTHVDVQGMAAIDGRDAYCLKLKLKDGQEERVWVDATSFLEVRIDSTRRFGVRSRPVRTYLRDFRSVSGVKIPFATETQVDGRPDPERIIVESASVNPPVDNSRFVPPVGSPAATPAVKPAATPAVTSKN